MDYRFLGKINSPDDVKKMNNEETADLCDELRDKIISTVSANGGHLASNLGVVELTVALHKVFDSPQDTIVFDVGHQCYAHKLLTGRFDGFSSLRQKDGVSGFMKPEESEHDPFITGHSSTSVSSAFGSCVGKRLNGEKGFSVAVLGDGALTGGMVYEALNNVRKQDTNLIVVLNDNKMSISKSRGALARHLGKIRSQKEYFRFKSGVEKVLIKIPLIGKPLYKVVFHIKLMVKNALYHSNIFESLGFYYMGPIDGHNIETLCEVMEISKGLNRPVLIHTKTVKGKGYKPAEVNPGDFHGVSSFDIESGKLQSGKLNFSQVFGSKLCELAEKDTKICAITAAMTHGTGLYEFSKNFKDRFFDVGIAEEHGVTFAAGLAQSGMKPVFAVYSTFLQRGYDQIIHDCAIAGLPLTICIDRAGLVGDDGETHQGVFDVSFLSSIPGVKIQAPATYAELQKILEDRLKNPKGVEAIRYPRGAEVEIPSSDTEFDGFKLYSGEKTAIVTYGTLVSEALKARYELLEDGIKTAVIKLDTLFPIPENLFSVLENYDNILFFEEGILSGGIAEKLGFELIKRHIKCNYKATAIEGFVKQASVTAQRERYGLDKASMKALVKEVNCIE